MDCSPTSPLAWLSQARFLEQVIIFSSRGSSWSRDQTHVSCIAGGFFAAEPSGKPVCLTSLLKKTISLNCADVHLIGERLGNVKWIPLFPFFWACFSDRFAKTREASVCFLWKLWNIIRIKKTEVEREREGERQKRIGVFCQHLCQRLSCQDDESLLLICRYCFDTWCWN